MKSHSKGESNFEVVPKGMHSQKDKSFGVAKLSTSLGGFVPCEKKGTCFSPLAQKPVSLGFTHNKAIEIEKQW